MSKFSSTTPSWGTSSFGHPADCSPLQRSELADHMVHCSAHQGHLQGLEDRAKELRSLLAGRVVTSVLLITLMVGASWLAL